jgi:hypothetical protein
MRNALRTGLGAFAVILIMIVGSFGLWLGTPLLWLWIGSQIQGASGSLGEALAAMFIGVVVTIGAMSSLLVWLSNRYRATCRARGQPDPGNVVLEGVLVISAGVTVVAFGIWFFFFAGTSPLPLGISL